MSASRRPRVVAMFALVTACAATIAAADELPADRREAIERAVVAEMSRREIPGLTIAVGIAGELAYADGFGFADLENHVPAKSETAYRLASVAKPMTAVAALQLAEQGLLDLDAPIQRYVPSFPEKAWPVTSRHLLAHLAGIRGYADGEMGSTRHYGSVTDALVLFRDDPLVHEPGTRLLYSSYGYNLVGAAIEAIARRPFIDHLRSAVLEPAGMSRTRDDDVAALIPNRAQGYVRTAAGGYRNSALADLSNKLPGGGLIGTASDVVHFGLALEEERLLGAERLREMLSRQKTRDGRQTAAGFGLYVARRGNKREAWHTGGQPRVSTVLYLQPDHGVVVGVLANLEGIYNPLLDLARQVADIVCDRSANPQVAPAASRRPNQ